MTRDQEIELLRNLKGMSEAMKVIATELKAALERIEKLEAASRTY